MKSTVSFALYCYFLLINGSFGTLHSQTPTSSISPIDESIFSDYDQSRSEYQRSIQSSEINTLIDEPNFNSSIETNIYNYKTDKLLGTPFESPLSHFNTEISLGLGMSSSILTSPIMGKSTKILGELSFKYSLDGIRREYFGPENNYLPTNLFNKLFGPKGAKNNSIGLLRYGFLYAIFSEIKNSFPKEHFMYKLSPKLLTDSLDYQDCIKFIREANTHNATFEILSVNENIFQTICGKVVKRNFFIEMKNWDNQIMKIMVSIKKNLLPLLNQLQTEINQAKSISLPKVPEVKVSGTDIKLRYLSIVKSIDAIKKKEQSLFKSLIFTKKTALKISAQYIPNGNELVGKCIEIIKAENPALMREAYQREKIQQICKVSMGI
ncbi:putative signal peptide-containing protein [Cryptosporidium canis]|uniref:Signal peptide-containing protein n=1 Tax=Cryptosporidium canis TaxID=195482 RepID=A0ABQ8P6T2_9CRYT|nr:putative signal peptide-containing protein [Cryptosporidium canis]KAJ1610866.1 putative signal peptide-containing protein [Cryptosporidium canis]